MKEIYEFIGETGEYIPVLVDSRTKIRTDMKKIYEFSPETEEQIAALKIKGGNQYYQQWTVQNLSSRDLRQLKRQGLVPVMMACGKKETSPTETKIYNFNSKTKEQEIILKAKGINPDYEIWTAESLSSEDLHQLKEKGLVPHIISWARKEPPSRQEKWIRFARYPVLIVTTLIMLYLMKESIIIMDRLIKSV